MDKRVFYFQNGTCNFLRLGNPDVFEFRIFKVFFKEYFTKGKKSFFFSWKFNLSVCRWNSELSAQMSAGTGANKGLKYVDSHRTIAVWIFVCFWNEPLTKETVWWKASKRLGQWWCGGKMSPEDLCPAHTKINLAWFDVQGSHSSLPPIIWWHSRRIPQMGLKGSPVMTWLRKVPLVSPLLRVQ